MNSCIYRKFETLHIVLKFDRFFIFPSDFLNGIILHNNPYPKRSVGCGISRYSFKKYHAATQWMWQRHLRFGFPHFVTQCTYRRWSRTPQQKFLRNMLHVELCTSGQDHTSKVNKYKSSRYKFKASHSHHNCGGNTIPPSAMAESMEVPVRSTLMAAGYLLVRVPNSIAGIWVSELWRCMMRTSHFYLFFNFRTAEYILHTSKSASEAGSEHRLPCSKWHPFPFLRKTLLILTGLLPNRGLQYQPAFQNITCHVI